jgi:4-amino-4-deoxy-L-arabinose transferase-like glycosyltransferase
MPNFFKDNRVIIAIMLLALVLRLCSFVVLKPWDEKVQTEKIIAGDAVGYQTIAINLLDRGEFKGDSLNGKANTDNTLVASCVQNYDTLRTPGYPFFLFIIYWLFGIKVSLVIFFQIILNIASLLIVFSLAKLIFNNIQVANIAALLFAIEPHQIYYCLLFYSETLFVSMILFFTLLFAKGLKNKSIPYFIFSAIVLGLCILIRPIAMLIPLLLIVLLPLSPIKGYLLRFKIIAIYVVLCAIIASPWLYRNYKEYHHTSLCTDQGVALLLNNAAVMETMRTHQPFDTVINGLQKQVKSYGYDSIHNPFDREAIFSKVAINCIKQHIPYYAKTHIEGMFLLFIATDHRSIAHYIGVYKEHTNPTSAPLNISAGRLFSDNLATVCIGVFIILSFCFAYLFFAIGSFFMLKNGMVKMWIALAFIMAYFAFLTGNHGLTGGSRFKLEIIPFYLIVAAYGIYRILNRKQKKVE